MNKIFLLFLMAITFRPVFSQNKNADKLKRLNQQWIHSLITKDTTILSNILADDFILISPNGGRMTKSDNLNSLKTLEVISDNIDSVDVRLLTNDVGLVTAYTTFVIKSNDKNVRARNCYQDVYVKRNGKWFAVAAHVTLLSTE
jgi:hypothetical protein